MKFKLDGKVALYKALSAEYQSSCFNAVLFAQMPNNITVTDTTPTQGSTPPSPVSIPPATLNYSKDFGW